MVSLQYVISGVLPQWLHLYIFSQCVLSAVLSEDFYETFITMAALLWLLPSVYCLIFNQITYPSKAFVTIAALVRLLPTVYSVVLYQKTFMNKTFVTMATLIWPVSSVYSLMIYQSIFF